MGQRAHACAYPTRRPIANIGKRAERRVGHRRVRARRGGQTSGSCGRPLSSRESDIHGCVLKKRNLRRERYILAREGA